MTSRTIRMRAYIAPAGCGVSREAHFLGASISRCASFEPFGDDDVGAWLEAMQRDDLASLLVLALVRRRTPGEVATVLSCGVVLALGNGVASRIEDARRAAIERAVMLASSTAPDPRFAAEVRDRFWRMRPETDLTCAVAELLDLVGRLARAGAGGAAERCADRLASLIDGELGLLGGRELRQRLVSLVDDRLGAAVGPGQRERVSISEAAE